uniref:Uncharacterized protein n=1 Tax=Labrus bergylta TaxID=56723 RepID=A0A3Q3EFZ4_9LABR
KTCRDVVFLQDTHLTRQEHEKLKKTTNSQVYYSSCSSAPRGVAIIIKLHVGFEKENCTTDREGRYVLVVGKIESVDISFLKVYYPPDTGPELMSKLIDLIMTKSKGVVILGGNLNMIMNTLCDFFSSNEKSHRAEKTVQQEKNTKMIQAITAGEIKQQIQGLKAGK